MKELFMTGLFFVSILTTLTVEAIKKLRKKATKNPNLLAAIVATTLSICVAVFYILYFEIPVTIQIVLIVIAFAFFSWLVSMAGFDKVKQLIQQSRNEVVR